MYIVYSFMCLIFGATFLAIKIGVDAGAPPFLFAGTRFLFAGIVVLGVVKLRKGKIALEQQHLRDVMIVGIFMTGFMFGCLYWGEKYISSSIAALLAATTPIMIGLVEWFQGVRENPLVKGCGLVIAFVGVAIAVLPALGVAATTEAVLAVLVILAAEVGCVYGTMTSKKILVSGFSPFVLNGWQMVIGGGLLLLLSLLTEGITVKIDQPILLSWLYLVVFGSLVGHGSYYWLVRRAGPLLPSTWTYVSPVIAQFVGYYVLAEYLSGYSFIGLGLVISGVILVSKAGMLEKLVRKQLKKLAVS